MIEIKNLNLKYIREYFALYNINLKVEEGECVAFTGCEHSGRTTLLRAIAGLEKIDSGEIFLAGRDIKQVDFKSDLQLGYIPVVPVFFDNKSVYDNLKYVLLERKMAKNEVENKIDQTLIDFKIEKYKNIKIKDLSLFEKYVVSIVRLSLRKLDILLVDDIFCKLEDEEAKAILQLLTNVFLNKKVTSILTSENFELLKDVASREIKLENGSIVD